MNILNYFSIIESDITYHDVLSQNISNLLNSICKFKVPCLLQGDFVRKYYHFMDTDINELNIFTTYFDYYLLNDVINNSEFMDISGKIDMCEYRYIDKTYVVILDNIKIKINMCNDIRSIYLQLYSNYLGLDCVVYDYGISTWLEAKVDNGESYDFNENNMITYGIREKSNNIRSTNDIINSDICNHYLYNVLGDNRRGSKYYTMMKSFSYDYLMDIILQRYISTYDKIYYGKNALVTSFTEFNTVNDRTNSQYYNRKIESNKYYLCTSNVFEEAYENSINTLFSKYNYDTAMTILLSGLLKTNSVKIVDEIENDYFESVTNKKTQIYIPLYGRKYILYILNKIFPCTIHGEDKIFDSDYYSSNLFNQLLDLIIALKFNNRATKDQLITKFDNTSKSAAILVSIAIMSSTSFISSRINGRNEYGEDVEIIKLALNKLESLSKYVSPDIYNRALCIMYLLLNCPLSHKNSYYENTTVDKIIDLFNIVKPIIISNTLNYKFNADVIEQLVILYLLININLRCNTELKSQTPVIYDDDLTDLHEMILNDQKRDTLYEEKFNSLNISIDDILKIVNIDSNYFDIMSYLYINVTNGNFKNEKNELLSRALEFIINSKRMDLRWNIR